MNPDAGIDWEKVRPTLDCVVGELKDEDRDAVVLRFYEGKSLAEVAVRLRLTENAARMRVNRALEKLHAALTRQGVTSSTAALAVALANQTAVAAPAGMAASIASGAVTLGTTGGGLGVITFMSTSKFVAGTAGVVAAFAMGAAVYEFSQLRVAHNALAAAGVERGDLQVKLRETQARLEAQESLTRAAEADGAELLKLVTALRAARPPQTVMASASAPITRDFVDARHKHAQELARNGDHETALAEFLWCYDEGFPRVTGYGAVRSTFLLEEIAKLVKDYPPALAALRERRDKAEQRMLASASDRDAASDFTSLNAALNENDRNLAAFDSLPAGDPRRQILLLRVYDVLISAQRYSDALQALPFATMNSDFEMNSAREPSTATSPNPQAARQRWRLYVSTTTAQNIEVLAGAGDTANAQKLAAKLVAYDPSDETKTLLQTHLARAGHPELLPAPRS